MIVFHCIELASILITFYTVLVRELIVFIAISIHRRPSHKARILISYEHGYMDLRIFYFGSKVKYEILSKQDHSA
jgi:hypothetical protein